MNEDDGRLRAKPWRWADGGWTTEVTGFEDKPFTAMYFDYHPTLRILGWGHLRDGAVVGGEVDMEACERAIEVLDPVPERPGRWRRLQLWAAARWRGPRG